MQPLIRYKYAVCRLFNVLCVAIKIGCRLKNSRELRINDEFRGRGYATEALRLAHEWAFGHSGVDAVEAETDPDNIVSQKVLTKCRFKAAGVIGEEGPRYIVYKEKR